MPERKRWIDMLRGFCMMAILLFHTEVYYTGNNIINYNFYVVNAITIFFIISGYLFYRKEGLNIRHKLKSIVKGLFIPYFIFTAAIALPKAFIYDNLTSVGNIAINIIIGNASWFVAALAVAEILLVLILKFIKDNNLILIITAIIALGISILLSNGNQRYPWYADNAMQALFFMILGYLINKNGKLIHTINTKSYTFLILILLILLKIYENKSGLFLTVCPIHISNYAIYITDCLLCFFLMANICSHIPAIKPIEWTGSHSLVYYFICGGVPMLTALLLNHIGFAYNNNYIQVIIAFIIVYVVSTAITWLIYRYVPYIAGKNNRQ